MNLTASVLHLDRTAVKALRITDPYSLHRVVYSLYEDQRDDAGKAESQSSGILYADQGGDFNGRKILLLANRPPASAVDGRYGAVRSRAIPDDFLEYDRYRFKVIINPTRRDNASRKLVPIKGRDAIAQWFLEKSVKSWGFDAASLYLQVDRMQVLQFKDKSQRLVTLAQAHIQGHLRVTDRDKFRFAFSNGLGRGRAFGCGLLQIVPLTETFFA